MKPKYGTMETYEFVTTKDFLATMEKEFFPDTKDIDRSIKVPWFTKFADEPELLFCMN